MLDVMQRLQALRRSLPALRLYGLVDGVQYEAHRNERLGLQHGVTSLFDGTADAALASAGPWLVDVQAAGESWLAHLAELEPQAPAVCWLIAPQDLAGLAQLLQLNLDLRLPDGRAALLRFWDPRVLAGLAGLLEPEQREAFFGPVHEWHLLHEGRRVWIGRPHADAQ